MKTKLIRRIIPATVTLLATALLAAPVRGGAASPPSDPNTPGPAAYSVQLKPGVGRQTRSFQIPAPQAACDALLQDHPDLPKRPCATVVTVSLESSTTSSTTGHVQPNATGSGSTSTQLCSVYGCWAWHSKAAVAYHYNGSGVWQDWIDCSDTGGIGYSVAVTWCGTWNNGGGNGYGYMSSGSNINVSAVAQGLPLSQGYWQRMDIYTDGGVNYRGS